MSLQKFQSREQSESTNQRDDELIQKIGELARNQPPTTRKALPTLVQLNACETNGEVAELYSQSGYPVFPHTPSETAANTSMKNIFIDQATADTTVIRKHWADNPDALVAVPTGRKTDIFVLTFNCNGKAATKNDIAEYLAKFNLAGIPDVPIARTPNGVQVFFRWPIGALLLAAKLGNLITIMGGDSFIIAPGTRTSGEFLYTWLEGMSPESCCQKFPPGDLVALLQRNAPQVGHPALGGLLSVPKIDLPDSSRKRPLGSVKCQARRTPNIVRVSTSLGPSERDDFLIEGMLHPRELAMLVGKPGTLKSFVAADIATSVASGQNWAGQTVNKNGVLFFSLEGNRGIAQRFRALALSKKMDEQGDHSLGLLETSVNLCSADAQHQLNDVVSGYVQIFGKMPCLIIFDTLARAFGGDENSSRDMGHCIRTLQNLIDETGATILLVHHSGKGASDGPRGHSSLEAACDTIFAMEKKKGETIFHEQKQKDAACSFQTVVQLKTVQLQDSSIDGSDSPETCLPVYVNTRKKKAI